MWKIISPQNKPNNHHHQWKSPCSSKWSRSWSPPHPQFSAVTQTHRTFSLSAAWSTCRILEKMSSFFLSCPVPWSQNCMTSGINSLIQKKTMFVLLTFSCIHELTWLSTGKTGVSESKQAGKHNTAEEGNKGVQLSTCTRPQSSFTSWLSMKSTYDISSNLHQK